MDLCALHVIRFLKPTVHELSSHVPALATERSKETFQTYEAAPALDRGCRRNIGGAVEAASSRLVWAVGWFWVGAGQARE